MIVAAIADLHCRVSTKGLVKKILEGVQDEAEVLVVAGDLTDTGLPEELEVLLEDVHALSIPILAVFGNHDHESGKAADLADMIKGSNIHLLEGTSYEIDGVGFVGAKGFCGGFDKTLIQPFGEAVLKAFIRSSIDEAVLLENSLARLQCDTKVAVLHYSPVKATLEGEPQELFAFLGSSRLANALDRQKADLAVHGHAHHGSPHGRTPGNIPVHNVSRFVLDKYSQRNYCILEL